MPLHDDLFDFFYEALPGYEEVGRRRVLLGCWGSYQDPDVCDYNYKTMPEWGRAMFVTPGVVVDGELVTNNLVDINLNIRILLGHSYYEDWDQSETFVKTDPLGNPVDQKASVESDDDPAAAEARLQRQVFVGDVPALARSADRRSSGAGYRRRADRAALVDGFGGPGQYWLHPGDRPQRQDLLTQDRAQARDGARVEDSEVEQRDRARSRAHLFPGLLRRRPHSTSSRRR